jgi:hypothetical protein
MRVERRMTSPILPSKLSILRPADPLFASKDRAMGLPRRYRDFAAIGLQEQRPSVTDRFLPTANHRWVRAQLCLVRRISDGEPRSSPDDISR